MKSILSRLNIQNSQHALYRQSLRLFATKKFEQKNRTASILGDELFEEHSHDRSSPISSDEFTGVCGHSSVIDKADFAQARIGDVLEIPYEVTASDFWREMWQSVFYQQDRIHTSIEYVNSIRKSSSSLGP
eukprot:194918_1